MDLIYPNFSKGFCKGESPDWQDEGGNRGLEVTRAENPHLGYTSFFSSKYLGKDRNSIPDKELSKFKGSTFFEKGRLVCISDSKGLVDGKRHIHLAIEALTRKLNLLNGASFRMFRENIVFLFLHGSVLEHDLEVFLGECQNLRDKHNKQFEKIVLLDYMALHIIDIAETKCSKVELTDSDLECLKSQALEMSGIDDWKVGTQFSDVMQKLE